MEQQKFDDAFWDGIDEAPPQEELGGVFDELPVGKFFIGRTATEEDGNWAPKLAPYGDPVKGYRFRTGFKVIGGEKGQDKLLNRWQPFGCFVLPGDRAPEGAILDGRLVGFLNCVFATGVGSDEKDAKVKSALRWDRTKAVLRQVMESHPDIDKPSYFLQITGDERAARGLTLVNAACVALREEARTVLFKTAREKQRENSQYEPQVIARPEEFTEESAAKRKVSLYEEHGDVVRPASAPQNPTF